MSSSLKIATYNIFHGRKSKKITSNLVKLKEVGVNIICLQELSHYSSKKFLLNDLLLNLGPSWQAEYFVKPDSHDLGLAILWDSNIASAKSFSKLFLPKVSRLKIFQKALEQFTSKNAKPLQRGAIVANFEINGKSLRVINVHLDLFGGNKQRAKQLHFLNLFLNSQAKTQYEILCGDFNTIGFYKLYKRRLKKIGKLVGGNFKVSQPKKSTFRYWQTLDHILAKNTEILNSEVLKLKGSDHYPLVSEVKI